MNKKKIDLGLVKKLIISGDSCRDVSKKIGVSYGVISRAVQKMDFPDDINLKWRPSLKKLSQEELDVLIGGLLGDSWIGYSKTAANASGSFTHKKEHEAYTIYKYNKISRLCAKPTLHNKQDKRTGKKYIQSFCKIATNPLLNGIANSFYVDGKKIVCEDFLYKLSKTAVAIWFFDDGSKTEYSYKISTNCFSKNDIDILIRWLSSFEICGTMNCQNEILISSSTRDNLTKILIASGPPECVKYKIHALPYFGRKDKKKRLYRAAFDGF